MELTINKDAGQACREMIETLCKRKGITVEWLEKECQMDPGEVAKLSDGVLMPYWKGLNICWYFGVSVDDLFHDSYIALGEKPEKELTFGVIRERERDRLKRYGRIAAFRMTIMTMKDSSYNYHKDIQTMCDVTKIHRKNVDNWLQGLATPNIHCILAMCDYIECPIEAMFPEANRKANHWLKEYKRILKEKQDQDMEIADLKRRLKHLEANDMDPYPNLPRDWQPRLLELIRERDMLCEMYTRVSGEEYKVSSEGFAPLKGDPYKMLHLQGFGVYEKNQYRDSNDESINDETNLFYCLCHVNNLLPAFVFEETGLCKEDVAGLNFNLSTDEIELNELVDVVAVVFYYFIGKEIPAVHMMLHMVSAADDEKFMFMDESMKEEFDSGRRSRSLRHWMWMHGYNTYQLAKELDYDYRKLKYYMSGKRDLDYRTVVKLSKMTGIPEKKL